MNHRTQRGMSGCECHRSYCHYMVEVVDRDKPHSYLVVYVGLVVGSLFLFAVGNSLFVFGSLGASRNIHQRLVSSVLGTTMRFVSQRLSGRT